MVKPLWPGVKSPTVKLLTPPIQEQQCVTLRTAQLALAKEENRMFCHQIGQRLFARFIAGQEPLPFDHHAAIFQETSKVIDRHMVDIWRVIPAVRKLFGHRHLAAKHMRHPDPPLGEVGKGNKSLLSDTQHMIENKIRPAGSLQRLAENDIVEAAIGIINQIAVGVPLHHR